MRFKNEKQHLLKIIAAISNAKNTHNCQKLTPVEIFQRKESLRKISKNANLVSKTKKNFIKIIFKCTSKNSMKKLRVKICL
jgi:hypothetical protein